LASLAPRRGLLNFNFGLLFVEKVNDLDHTLQHCSGKGQTFPSGASECDGNTVACQIWPISTGVIGSASLGQVTSLQYSDMANGIEIVAGGGSIGAGGVNRRMSLKIFCGPSMPYPVLIDQDSPFLFYEFIWFRDEMCEP
jgi:hypothetical protein